MWSQIFVTYQNRIPLGLFIRTFGHILINRLIRMSREVLMKDLSTNNRDFEDPCPICLLTKADKISRGLNWCITPPRFIIQMDFVCFNIEIFCGFISTVMAICSDTSHPFGFPYMIKWTPLDIFKLLFTTLRNQIRWLYSYEWINMEH